MKLVVVVISLKMIDDLLPIGRENVLVLPMQTLVDLAAALILITESLGISILHLPTLLCKNPQLARNLVGIASSLLVDFESHTKELLTKALAPSSRNKLVLG